MGLATLSGCTADVGEDPATAPTETVTVTASPTPAPADPTPMPTPSREAPPTPVPTTGRSDPKLVIMTVTGGFAGVHQTVILRTDGTVHTSAEGEPRVRRTTKAQFTELRTLLGNPALAEVPGLTMDMGARDTFQYTLRIDGRTVITDRSVAEPALDRLIDALADWLPK
nr:protealysin inhibitor emfourin [Streptomyces cupreus]